MIARYIMQTKSPKVVAPVSTVLSADESVSKLKELMQKRFEKRAEEHRQELALQEQKLRLDKEIIKNQRSEAQLEYSIERKQIRYESFLEEKRVVEKLTLETSELASRHQKEISTLKEEIRKINAQLSGQKESHLEQSLLSMCEPFSRGVAEAKTKTNKVKQWIVDAQLEKQLEMTKQHLAASKAKNEESLNQKQQELNQGQLALRERAARSKAEFEQGIREVLGQSRMSDNVMLQNQILKLQEVVADLSKTFQAQMADQGAKHQNGMLQMKKALEESLKAEKEMFRIERDLQHPLDKKTFSERMKVETSEIIFDREMTFKYERSVLQSRHDRIMTDLKMKKGELEKRLEVQNEKERAEQERKAELQKEREEKERAKAQQQSFSLADSRTSSSTDQQRPFSSPARLAVRYLKDLSVLSSRFVMSPHIFAKADPKRPFSSSAVLERQSSAKDPVALASVSELKQKPLTMKKQLRNLVIHEPEKVLEFFKRNEFDIDLDTTRDALKTSISMQANWVSKPCYTDIIEKLREHKSFLKEQQKALKDLKSRPR